MVDPIALVLGVAVGVLGGLLVSYFTFYAKPRRSQVKVLSRDQSGAVQVKTVSAGELEHSKREMRTLMLERDLLSSALTRIYEAETEGKITKEEREMIARRYSEQIKEIEGKLRDRELLVEVGELERLRDELVSLFEEKIQNIEARLEQAKDRLHPVREQEKPEIVKKQQLPPSDDLEKVVERKAPRKEETEGERRARELRDEVMEALASLEQIDIKRENESA